MIKRNSINLISLIIIQASNAVVPLILFPFVLKVMGSDAYAKVVTTEALMFIIYAFSLYSFEINGVSSVVNSRHEVNTTTLGKVFINIFLIRFSILFIIGFFIFIFYLFYQNTFIELLLLWLLYPLSFIFQSAYFFQGLEKNVFLALFVLVSRVFTLIFIFVFISDSSDIYLVPTLIGGTYMFAGILSFLYIWIKYKISLNLIDFTYIKALILEGKEIFFGNVSVILFRGSNVLLLEVFTHDAIAVSAYSIAEKFIKSLQAVMRPLNQYYFPKAIVMLQKSTYPNKYSFLQLFKLSVVQLLALLCVIIILFITYINRSYINALNTYPHIEHIATVIAIMLPAVFVGILNFMFGSVGLNHLNKKSYYAKAIFTTGILSLVIASVLIVYLKDYGAAMAFLISESLLLLFIISQYLKKNTHMEA